MDRGVLEQPRRTADEVTNIGHRVQQGTCSYKRYASGAGPWDVIGSVLKQA